jgi:hypothetical protein
MAADCAHCCRVALVQTKAKERASKFTCGAKEVLPELPKPFVVKEYDSSFAPFSCTGG